MVNTLVALTPRAPWLLTSDARVTAARCFRVAVPTAVGARSGKPAGTSVCTRFRTRLGNSAGPQQRAPDIDVPGKRGRGRLQPGRMPGDDGIADTGTVAPARGLCAPGTAGGRASGATAWHAVIFICHRDAMQLEPLASRYRVPEARGHAWRTHFVSAGP
jgi:hypothetical protein